MEGSGLNGPMIVVARMVRERLEEEEGPWKPDEPWEWERSCWSERGWIGWNLERAVSSPGPNRSRLQAK